MHRDGVRHPQRPACVFSGVSGMSTPATLHHLADALTALRLAHDATGDGFTADRIEQAEASCLRAVEQAAPAAMTVDFETGSDGHAG